MLPIRIVAIPTEVAEAIEELFASPQVDYLQVNSTTAGCFTFRIERNLRQ